MHIFYCLYIYILYTVADRHIEYESLLQTYVWIQGPKRILKVLVFHDVVCYCTRWWFQTFFMFTPKIGEDEPIFTNIFQVG